MMPTLPAKIAGRLALLMAAVAVLSVVMALAAACGGSAGAVIDHSASIRPDNSLIAEVRVTLSREARVFVEYDNPDAGRFRTALSEPGTSHTIPVVRLRPESEYAYTVNVQDSDGAVALGPSGKFTTGRLPDRIDVWQTWVSGRSTQPLILTDYRAGDSTYYIFWDEAGNIVWYYINEPVDGFHAGTDVPHRGASQGIEQKANGNLVYLSYFCCITEITPLGEVVDRILGGDESGIPHHDIEMLDDGRILYPSDVQHYDSANGGDADAAITVDILNIWNPQSGRIEQVWDSRDFWDISDPAQWGMGQSVRRWTHINSVNSGRRGNFIISSRNRHQIFSLSPDFQSIEWQLGGPDSDYAFPNPNDRFYGQHTASELPNGNILLFDNGNGRPYSEGGKYSRALELRLDNEARTAVKVWEYRSTPDIYSSIVSSAFRLKNGNTLVNFGTKPGTVFGPFTFVETDPQGNDIFRVETSQPDPAPNDQDRIVRYRAYGDIAAIMGETMLRPPVARPVMGEHTYKSRFQQIRDIDAGLDRSQRRARERFDVYFDGDSVIYRKEQCAAADTAEKFFLHIFPENPGDLPEERQEHGFDNIDFHFRSFGTMWDGKCLAITRLPGYEIARISTGQYVSGGEQTWRAEFPVGGQDAAR